MTRYYDLPALYKNIEIWLYQITTELFNVSSGASVVQAVKQHPLLQTSETINRFNVFSLFQNRTFFEMFNDNPLSIVEFPL